MFVCVPEKNVRPDVIVAFLFVLFDVGKVIIMLCRLSLIHSLVFLVVATFGFLYKMLLLLLVVVFGYFGEVVLNTCNIGCVLSMNPILAVFFLFHRLFVGVICKNC